MQHSPAKDRCMVDHSKYDMHTHTEIHAKLDGIIQEFRT